MVNCPQAFLHVFHPKEKEKLKRMRLSSQQVESMKCSNEIREGYGWLNDYRLKYFFSSLSIALSSVQSLINPLKVTQNLIQK
mgnify:CR=1 FL=1